jgi:hypothetical protein
MAIFSMVITAKREESYKGYWRSANFDAAGKRGKRISVTQNRVPFTWADTAFGDFTFTTNRLTAKWA